MNYRRAVELVRTSGKAAKIPDVKEVITRMQSSLTAAYLGDCSLHERIMLASLIKCILRSGVLEVPWDEVRKNSLSPSLQLPLFFLLFVPSIPFYVYLSNSRDNLFISYYLIPTSYS